jgi:hypothetical protein
MLLLIFSPSSHLTFTFTYSLSLSLSSLYMPSARVCQPQDVTLHLKAGSYPVISPENITFPKHFLSAEQRLVLIYDMLFIDLISPFRLLVRATTPSDGEFMFMCVAINIMQHRYFYAQTRHTRHALTLD